MHRTIQKIICLALMVSLSGCTTVKRKISDFDFIKLPEFKEEAENIGDYQSVANAPKFPSDVRSDANWDDSARTLMGKRDNFSVPRDGSAVLSEVEIQQKITEIGAKIDEYKLDDPQ